MYEILLSDNQDCLTIHEAWVLEVVRRTLAAEQVASAEIGIALVDDATIHAVNREHLHHDYPTDVISFVYDTQVPPDPATAGILNRPAEPLAQAPLAQAPLSTADSSCNEASVLPKSPLPRGRGLWVDGELVVSTETAHREASGHGWEPEDELLLYIVHGLLHLCGYDDLSQEEQQIMRERERSILKIWNLTPHYN